MQIRAQNIDLKQLTKVLEDFPAIKAAYLFGSHADSTANQESDIDVGLIGDATELESLRLAILSSLAQEGFSNIDLVIFSNAPIQLQYEIAHHNRVLFARDYQELADIFSLTLRKYWDFRHLLKQQAEIYKEHLING